jgi:hypothetical protein
MTTFPTRWTTVLIVAVLLLAGCGDGKKGEQNEQPRNPLLGGPKAGAGGLRRTVDRPKVRNDLDQLYKFYNLFINDLGHAPKTLDEFKEYIKRDAHQLYQRLSEGYYGLVVGTRPAGNSILAYERVPDASGDHIVIRGDHSLDTLKTDALNKALQNPN